MADVLMTCPLCGRALRKLSDASAESAPYACDYDARAYWGSELTSEARNHWNPETRSIHDPDIRGRVMEGVRDELARTRARHRDPVVPTPVPPTPRGGKRK